MQSSKRKKKVQKEQAKYSVNYSKSSATSINKTNSNHSVKSNNVRKDFIKFSLLFILFYVFKIYFLPICKYAKFRYLIFFLSVWLISCFSSHRQMMEIMKKVEKKELKY